MKAFPLMAILLVVGAGALVVRSGLISAPVQDTPGMGHSSQEDRTTVLPKDVYADSRGRLPKVKREDLDEHGKRVYDSILPHYPGGLLGPIGIWMHSPRLVEHMFQVRTYLRFETQFSRRLAELTVLVTARELDNQLMWSSHERYGREEGLEPEIIDIVKNRKSVKGLGEEEALIILFGRELMGRRKLSSETFARALKLFGRKGATDLSAVMGFYSFIDITQNTFDLQPRAD